MIVGADVSHAAPGSQAASFAAFTLSMDAAAVRYAAAVQTNGVRVEMIATRNLEDMLKPLFHEWVTTVGGGRLPKHVYYFRDGVSEGQYQNVLKQEVADMKRVLYNIGKHVPNLEVSLLTGLSWKPFLLRISRSSLLWWWPRSAITFASSPPVTPERLIGTVILFQAPWSKRMLPIRLNTISIYAPTPQFKVQRGQLIIIC